MMVDFAKMSIPDDVAEFTKRWEAGAYDHATKDFWHRMITEKAEKARRDGESVERAYARLIISDPAGRALFKAYQRAPNGEPPPVQKAADGTQHIGPHHARAHVEAVARQRERAISYSAPMSEILTKDPALAAAVREEHLAHALGMMNGAGGSQSIPSGVTGTLSIQQAQNLEPARSFRGTGYDRDIASKSAESELEALSRARHAADPSKSYEQHYVKVMLENPQIAKRARDERAAALGCRIAV